MNPYTVTNEPECADLVFEISMTHSNDASFNPIDAGLATYVDNDSLFLNNIENYPEGKLTVSI